MERILINLKNKKKNNLLNFTSYYTQTRNSNEKRNNLINEFKEVHAPIKEYVYNKISEAEGLEKAYAHGDYFIHGKTMYVAGSHTKKDWYDDVTKVPDWGDLRQSTRYQAAEKALKENPQVSHVVGHSLGGSVALQLEQDYPNQIKTSRTYGAPVLDAWKGGNPERYRHYGDPVSILDRSAKSSIKLNPTSSMSLTHDYSEMAGKFASTEEKPADTENPEGKSSIG